MDGSLNALTNNALTQKAKLLPLKYRILPIASSRRDPSPAQILLKQPLHHHDEVVQILARIEAKRPEVTTKPMSAWHQQQQDQQPQAASNRSIPKPIEDKAAAETPERQRDHDWNEHRRKQNSQNDSPASGELDHAGQAA